ncbi:uncharacterized protein LOC107260986 [Ricinus communis]|uniref:uncharacterized protein LOC107260986 n=1 Tax=Ricinus communis TaxID=3988 RepID=UPI00201AF432|nr:uncharacterized protein LOC107260986 [Ricinus communis]
MLHQIRQHEEEVVKALKALSYIHAVVSDPIFTKIIACESAHEAWEKLKTEFQGSDKTRQMQVFNLRKEFELLKMKDAEKVKDYVDRVMKIVNQIRLLGEELEERRIVEKVMVTLPEKFEAKISSLRNAWDMSQITLPELTNALLAVEQRKAPREEESVGEKALAAVQKMSSQEGGSKNQTVHKKGKNKKIGRWRSKKDKYPPCPYCKKSNHTENYCWFRPGAQYKICKQFGHTERVCTIRNDQQTQAQPAQTTENNDY